MEEKSISGKLPGKTKWSGRRRPMTRKSGYRSHPNSTGGELIIKEVSSIHLEKDSSLKISFILPSHNKGQFVGFGGWFSAPELNFELTNPLHGKNTLKHSPQPDWGKVGSMWKSDGNVKGIEFLISANQDCDIAIWQMDCGVIYNKHLREARTVLLNNMHEYSPEAHFFSKKGKVRLEINAPRKNQDIKDIQLYLKSCNRCARFLPINIGNERVHLSFTNHCVATHRTPCSHSGFGKLTNVDNGDELQLNHGFQLECRFCKKFEVNAPHNPQRTPAQMKEDGTRRRAIELLLMELYDESLQLSYRRKKNSELTNDVWERFNKRCFSCGILLESPNEMHLDHTRPLALMWPLDETATALCKSCNSEKRDRPPSEYYSREQLDALAQITGLPIEELEDPSPNQEAIHLLLERLDWFFDEFLTQETMTREHDGKVPAELLIKALQKTLNRYPGGAPVDLSKELKTRRNR